MRDQAALMCSGTRQLCNAAPQRSLLIAVPGDSAVSDDMPCQQVGDMYLQALAHFAGVLPLIVPAGATQGMVEACIDLVHGVLLTGAVSNVHPACYGAATGPHTMPHSGPHDRARDSVALQLVTLALQRDLPVLGICRGCQELNVACGGTLETEVQDQPGRLDHRTPDSADLSVCFAPRHAVQIAPGGLLHRTVGTHRMLVNSLHRQAVGQPGPGVAVQARASDGVIEAISVPLARFALGVQWHPEAGVPGDAGSLAIFSAFVQASRQHQHRRRVALQADAAPVAAPVAAPIATTSRGG